MKTTLPYFAILAILGSAFAGDGIVISTRTYQTTDSGARCGRMKDAGTPGAFYHSNFPGNAVVLLNKTPEYVTFFIYFADMRGPNDVDEMIRLGAPVYPSVVSPYQKGMSNMRGSSYWVSSRPGKWRIDPVAHRLVSY